MFCREAAPAGSPIMYSTLGQDEAVGAHGSLNNLI